MNKSAESRKPEAIVIYACSGCSDAGELADRAARTLSQMKLGQMSCLAGIGGRVKPIMTQAEQADHIVAIDGCPLNCGRHTLARAGFERVNHLELQRLGMRKGSCPPDAARLATVVRAGMELINGIAKPIQ